MNFFKEIKQLQDENINLKLRIYLLEENNKNSDYNTLLISMTNDQFEALNEKVKKIFDLKIFL